MDNLTNEAKYLLSLMYKTYLQRRKSGILRRYAIQFGSLEEVHSELMSNKPIEDVKSICLELIKQKWINGRPAATTIRYISLTSEAIASLETTFKDRMDDVLAFLTKIKNATPFL
ncbi:hypothetical protein [Enterococcus sp. DIV1420a]|uniref:hypothetical protein n=1 Tax=Enterococcus TaxID=1350 RepID=UPI003F29CC6D